MSERVRSYKTQEKAEGPLQRDVEEKKRGSFLDEYTRVILGDSKTESTELRREWRQGKNETVGNGRAQDGEVEKWDGSCVAEISSS